MRLKWEYRSEAVALEGFVRGKAVRRYNLAFISLAKGSTTKAGSSFVRFYDPLTLKDCVLPNRNGHVYDDGEPVLVEYAVRPAGTFRHVSKNYHAPPDMPYPSGIERGLNCHSHSCVL